MLGPADMVTLARALLVGGVTAVVAEGLLTGWTARGALVALAAVALVLDAVDGKVARRTGTTSPVGARFDMEVDAFLVLVLSVHVAGIVGPWALVIGGMRYAFVVAGWLLPWLRGAGAARATWRRRWPPCRAWCSSSRAHCAPAPGLRRAGGRGARSARLVVRALGAAAVAGHAGAVRGLTGPQGSASIRSMCSSPRHRAAQAPC